MLKVILTAAAGLALSMTAASACEYAKMQTTAQTPVPAVVAQTPVAAPATTAPAQELAQATVTKPAAASKTN
jgi:hypothetical protein